MEPKRIGYACFFVTVLGLMLMLGYFRGRNTLADPVRVVTQKSVQAALQDQETETRSETSSERPRPDAGVFPMNINTATAGELLALPGIGESRAQAIVAYREEHGPFTYVEDILNVSGIGEGILADIKDYITVGEQDNGEDLSG